MLGILAAEHLGGGLIELIGAPHFFEVGQQIFRTKTALVRPRKIVNDPAADHQ